MHPVYASTASRVRESPPPVARYETRTDPFRDLVRCQQSCRFDDPSLAVHPLRLDRIEPRTLARQEADDDPHPCLPALDCPVVLPDPSPHLLAQMPTGVVPHEQQRPLPLYCQPVAAPIEELRCHRAHRATVHEAQQHPFIALSQPVPTPHQQSVAGQCLRVGIAAHHHLLDQAQRGVLLRPTRQVWPRHPAPPDLVREAEGPVGMAHRQADQAIPPPCIFSMWHTATRWRGRPQPPWSLEAVKKRRSPRPYPIEPGQLLGPFEPVFRKVGREEGECDDRWIGVYRH